METNTATAKTRDKVAGHSGVMVCDLNKIDGRMHFVGIGGIGMSALARLLLSRGIKVSGSDKQASEITRSIISPWCTNFYWAIRRAMLSGAAALVVSTAITPDNPEFAWAQLSNCPIFHRSQILAALAKDKRLIAVSGTHGKTTTTAMIGKLLIDAGLDPSHCFRRSFPISKIQLPSRKGKYFVAEADESDGTHMTLFPQIAVVTNIEADHMENYPSGMKQILDTMQKFANQARDSGFMH